MLPSSGKKGSRRRFFFGESDCFTRIAGVYFDEEGFIDGTFNIHFLELSAKEQTTNLAIAKAIPFSDTNVNLKGFRFQEEDEKAGSIWKMLMALKECELKNDAYLYPSAHGFLDTIKI